MIWLILAIFWGVNCFLLMACVWERWGLLVIVVVHDKFLVKESIWRWSRQRDIELGESPLASLPNSVGHDPLLIRGQNGSLEIRTGLNGPDQRRLVAEINKFLGAHLSPELSWSSDASACAHCGLPLVNEATDSRSDQPVSRLCADCLRLISPDECRSVWQPLHPRQTEEIPQQLVIHEAIPGHWQFSYSLIPAGTCRTIMTFVMPAMGIGAGVIAWNAGTILLIPVSLSLLIHVPLTLFLLAGRFHVDLRRDLIDLRWGCGPLRLQKRIPVAAVTDCRMVNGIQRRSTSLGGAVQTTIIRQAGLIVDEETYPLVTLHGLEFAQRVVRLIRTFWSHELGHPLPDPASTSG